MAKTKAKIKPKNELESRLKFSILEIGKEVKELKPKLKEKKEKISSFKTVFSGEHVISKDKKAIDLHGISNFGEVKDKKTYYSLIEALYLLERGKISVYFKGKKWL